MSRLCAFALKFDVLAQSSDDAMNPSLEDALREIDEQTKLVG